MSDPTYYPTTPLPDWAEDETYPAGSDPWSGGPNKIEPVGAARNPGIQPDDQMGAQQYNWLNHRYGRLLRVFAHQPMQNWRAFTVAAEGSDAGPSGYSVAVATQAGTCAIPLYLKVANQFYPQQSPICALDVGGANLLTQHFSPNGLHWSAKAGPGDLGDPNCLSDAISPVGTFGAIIILGTTNSPFGLWSTDAGTSYVPSTVCPNPGMSPNEFPKVLHQAKNGRVFAGIGGGDGTPTSRFSYSDNQGGTWTYVDVSTAEWTVVSIADNGGSSVDAVIVATVNRDPSNTSPQIVRSLDNGATWSVMLTMSPSASPGDEWVGYVSYSPVWKQFMVVRPGTGEVLTSADGSAWTARTGFPQTDVGINQNESTEVSHVLKCIGSVFCFLVNALTEDVNLPECPGVMYTLDLGSSWHFVGLGNLTGFKRLINLHVWGGRFLVGSKGVVYYSDPVWCPGEDVAVT